MPEPVVLVFTSFRLRGVIPPANRRFPLPSTSGWIQSSYSSTRLCCISVCASLPLLSSSVRALYQVLDQVAPQGHRLQMPREATPGRPHRRDISLMIL